VPGEHHFFTPRTLATFRAAAACIVPPEDGSPGADSDGAVRVADQVLAGRPARDRKLLATFLRAVELLPVFRYGRGFSRLRREQQEAFLRFLERVAWAPKLRQGFFGLKTFALMGYYAQENTFAELGYPGPRRDAPYYQLVRGES
jgi:hypothetical protein